MKNFMEQDMNITQISLACAVLAGKSTPVHRNRPYHGLAFYVGGKSIFDFNGTKLQVEKNNIIYLPKQSDYTVETIEQEPGTVCYAINYDVSEKIHISPFVFSVKDANGVLKKFQNAERAWREKKNGFQMACKGELYRIICQLQREYALGYVPKDRSGKLLSALTRIHDSYTEGDILIAELAALCGMSETYFRRIFRKTKGVSPGTYIRNLKITRAKELLDSGMYSVSETAELSGFSDASYFSREFKKEVGISPLVYKEKKSKKV